MACCLWSFFQQRVPKIHKFLRKRPKSAQWRTVLGSHRLQLHKQRVLCIGFSVPSISDFSGQLSLSCLRFSTSWESMSVTVEDCSCTDGSTGAVTSKTSWDSTEYVPSLRFPALSGMTQVSWLSASELHSFHTHCRFAWLSSWRRYRSRFFLALTLLWPLWGNIEGTSSGWRGSLFGRPTGSTGGNLSQNSRIPNDKKPSNFEHAPCKRHYVIFTCNKVIRADGPRFWRTIRRSISVFSVERCQPFVYIIALAHPMVRLLTFHLPLRSVFSKSCP